MPIADAGASATPGAHTVPADRLSTSVGAAAIEPPLRHARADIDQIEIWFVQDATSAHSAVAAFACAGSGGFVQALPYMIAGHSSDDPMDGGGSSSRAAVLLGLAYRQHAWLDLLDCRAIHGVPEELQGGPSGSRRSGERGGGLRRSLRPSGAPGTTETSGYLARVSHRGAPLMAPFQLKLRCRVQESAGLWPARACAGLGEPASPVARQRSSQDPRDIGDAAEDAAAAAEDAAAAAATAATDDAQPRCFGPAAPLGSDTLTQLQLSAEVDTVNLRVGHRDITLLTDVVASWEEGLSGQQARTEATSAAALAEAIAEDDTAYAPSPGGGNRSAPPELRRSARTATAANAGQGSSSWVAGCSARMGGITIQLVNDLLHESVSAASSRRRRRVQAPPTLIGQVSASSVRALLEAGEHVASPATAASDLLPAGGEAGRSPASDYFGSTWCTLDVHATLEAACMLLQQNTEGTAG